MSQPSPNGWVTQKLPNFLEITKKNGPTGSTLCLGRYNNPAFFVWINSVNVKSNQQCVHVNWQSSVLSRLPLLCYAICPVSYQFVSWQFRWLLYWFVIPMWNAVFAVQWYDGVQVRGNRLLLCSHGRVSSSVLTSFFAPCTCKVSRQTLYHSFRTSTVVSGVYSANQGS